MKVKITFQNQWSRGVQQQLRHLRYVVSKKGFTQYTQSTVLNLQCILETRKEKTGSVVSTSKPGMQERLCQASNPSEQLSIKDRSRTRIRQILRGNNM